MKTRYKHRSRGFSLIEILVAVLIISVGLLGIAKLQALAISNTGNSRLRALAALQAASLASMMQADRSYWTSTPIVGTDLTVTITGSSISAASDATLSGAMPDCSNGATCTPVQLAAYDLQHNWIPEIVSVIPSQTTNIDCKLPAAAQPVTCKINMTWTENLINSNSAQNVNNATTKTALATPTYELVVQP
jgi:type IV pilus assembly protein PilV